MPTTYQKKITGRVHVEKLNCKLPYQDKQFVQYPSRKTRVATSFWLRLFASAGGGQWAKDPSPREMPGLVMHKSILSQRVVLLSGESRQSTSQQNFLRGLCGLSKGLWQTHSSMADYERDRKAKAAAKGKPKAKPKPKN